MNIFHKVALCGFKKNRTRTLVTVIGVALSAALITAVASFAVSLQNYMINDAVARYGSWHVGFWDVDSSFVQEQFAGGKVIKGASVKNIGYARLPGGTNPEKPYLFLAGYDREAFEMLPVVLYSGRMPENDSEILVPTKVSLDGGVKFSEGDVITLTVGDRVNGDRKLGQNDLYSKDESFLPREEKSYTVVGFCQRPAYEENNSPGYTLITKTDGKAKENGFLWFASLKNPLKLWSYLDRAGGKDGYVLNDNVLRFMGVSENDLFNKVIYFVGGIVIAIIVVGSVFLIYNSFNISLGERVHQFGILMSVGATERQLKNSVLFEGLVIGSIGIPVGILIGIPGTWLVLSLVSRNFANILSSKVSLTFKISAPVLAASALVSMATILISAYIPAKKAAAMPVMECIRQTGEIKVEAGKIKTSGLSKALWGLEGTLAIKNFKRNRRRYRSVVLSLTLSVVLFVTTSTLRLYMDVMSKEAIVEMDGDMIVYTSSLEEKEVLPFYQLLKEADSVTQSRYEVLKTYFCRVNTDDLTDEFRDWYLKEEGLDEKTETVTLLMDVQFIEDDLWEDYYIETCGLPKEEYAGENGRMPIVGLRDGGKMSMFSEPTMEFTLCAETGEEQKTVRTTFMDSYPIDPLPAEAREVRDYAFMITAPYSSKPQFDVLGEVPQKLGVIFWSDNPGRSTARMKEMIGEAGLSSDFYLYNMNEILEQNRNLIFIVNLFTAVFIAMISLISVANVFNTISTNIKLRRRELAMLRSVGMSDKAFNRMMRFECVLYGARTMLFGLPLSGIFAWLIYQGAVHGTIDGEEIFYFMFPWKSIGIGALSVFGVVFITMLYTTARIRKENIIDALRDEME